MGVLIEGRQRSTLARLQQYYAWHRCLCIISYNYIPWTNQRTPTHRVWILYRYLECQVSPSLHSLISAPTTCRVSWWFFSLSLAPCKILGLLGFFDYAEWEKGSGTLEVETGERLQRLLYFSIFSVDLIISCICMSRDIFIYIYIYIYIYRL